MDKSESSLQTHRIGILPIPGFAMMSYSSLAEPFRAANQLSGRTLYDVINLSKDNHPVPSSGAAAIIPETRIDEISNLDYLFVVSGGDPFSFNDPVISNWLIKIAESGLTLGGVSGGPVILAKAGLLDRYRMTLHWEHATLLAELAPHLLIERTLFVIDRDRVTCAGGTSALDLTHVLISLHHGSDFARTISDWFLHTEIRPSFGPQKESIAERMGVTNKFIHDSIRMMESHIADPLTLEQLASIINISPRQLNRLFREKMNVSTMQIYRELRLEQADKLLTSSTLSLTEIALATGFADSSHFSRVYRDVNGFPPSRQRSQ